MAETGRPPAQVIRNLVQGHTYVLTLDLADFYYWTLCGKRAKGRQIVRELVFTPAGSVRYRDGLIWTGVGIIGGEAVPGICRVGASWSSDDLRVGIGYDPEDPSVPAGSPGLCMHWWLGATTDRVLSVQERA